MEVQFVAAAIGIIIKDNKVLMIKREKEPFANLWSIPGGKIENDEYISSAVTREIWEEVGVKCEIQNYLGTISELVSMKGVLDRHHVIHAFQLSILKGAPIKSARWFDIDSLEQISDITPSDTKIIQEFIINKKFSYIDCHLNNIDGKYSLESFSSPCTK